MQLIKATWPNDKSTSLLLNDSMSMIFSILDEEASPFQTKIEIFDLKELSKEIYTKSEKSYLTEEDIKKLNLKDEEDLEEYKRNIYYEFNGEKTIDDLKNPILNFNLNDYDSDSILDIVKFILNYKHKIAGNFEVSLKENFKVENFLTLERLNDSSTGPQMINKLMGYVFNNLNDYSNHNLILLNIKDTNDFVFGSSNNLLEALNTFKQKYENLEDLTILGFDLSKLESEITNTTLIRESNEKSFSFHCDTGINELIQENLYNFSIKDNEIIFHLTENEQIDLEGEQQEILSLSFEKYLKQENKKINIKDEIGDYYELPCNMR